MARVVEQRGEGRAVRFAHLQHAHAAVHNPAVIQCHARRAGQGAAVDVEMRGPAAQAKGHGLKRVGRFGNARGCGVDEAIHEFGIGRHAQTRQGGGRAMRVATRDHHASFGDAGCLCHLCANPIRGGLGHADDVQGGNGDLRVAFGKHNGPHLERIEHRMRWIGVPMPLKHKARFGRDVSGCNAALNHDSLLFQ